jgi:hypothetical protein
MKCYAVIVPGELRKYILPTELREILPPVLLKRKRITSAYLAHEFFPGFSYERFKSRNYKDMYSFGITTLAEKQTVHHKYVPKNSILVLYDHKKFYCDRAEGDASRVVWLNHKFSLIITAPTHFRLREIGTSNSWAMDAKQTKLIQHVL